MRLRGVLGDHPSMPNDADASLDRRPIASRERAVFKRIAAWLARRGVSPNAISIAGMVAGIFGGAAFVATARVETPTPLWIAAAILIQLRLLANMLDGMVAIESGRTSSIAVTRTRRSSTCCCSTKDGVA